MELIYNKYIGPYAEYNKLADEAGSFLEGLGFEFSASANYVGWIKKGDRFNTMVSYDTNMTFNITVCNKVHDSGSDPRDEHKIFSRLKEQITFKEVKKIIKLLI